VEEALESEDYFSQRCEVRASNALLAPPMASPNVLPRTSQIRRKSNRITAGIHLLIKSANHSSLVAASLAILNRIVRQKLDHIL
jgi:hypothetical protein